MNPGYPEYEPGVITTLPRSLIATEKSTVTREAKKSDTCKELKCSKMLLI
jgi:hypothetical protein